MAFFFVNGDAVFPCEIPLHLVRISSELCVSCRRKTENKKREILFFFHCDEIAKQLPTNETGAPKNSLKAADVPMMEVKVSGRDSRRPVSESSMRFRRGSNQANPSSPTALGPECHKTRFPLTFTDAERPLC